MAIMNGEHGRLYYEVAGEGPTVILGHAGFVDSRMWDDQWNALTPHYRVIRYDMQGYGQSDVASGPVSRRAELLGLLRHLGVERAHFVGSSLSGAVFIDFALEQPALVASLVTANAVPNGFAMQGDPPRYLMEMFGAWQQGHFEQVSEFQLRIWIDGMFREPQDVNATLRQRVGLMNRTPVENRTWMLADLQPVDPLDPPAASRLGEITCPALIIDSTLDHPETRRAAQSLIAGLPHAQGVTIPDAAHLPNMEQPAAFNRAVLGFLSSLG
ncbi:MAG: alpha/beta fold hydrolase [Anaerolineae bacterium]|nr:alpha/beta fold hydrolase [Anaerolineae bacterium]